MKQLKLMGEEEMNDVLDSRDSNKVFEDKLLALAESLAEVDCEFSGESTFIKMSNRTNGHEICSYVIEDLELIEKARFANIKSEFIEVLVESYSNGIVPDGRAS